jgi:hypothetical protein
MLSFKRTNNAQKLLCQVWFQRGYRASGLKWRSSVVLNDSWWWVALLKAVWGQEGVGF